MTRNVNDVPGLAGEGMKMIHLNELFTQLLSELEQLNERLMEVYGSLPKNSGFKHFALCEIKVSLLKQKDKLLAEIQYFTKGTEDTFGSLLITT